MTANRLTQWQIGDLAAARCTGSLGLAAALLSLVANHPIAAIAAYSVLMAYTLWLLRGGADPADRREPAPNRDLPAGGALAHTTGSGTMTAMAIIG